MEFTRNKKIAALVAGSALAAVLTSNPTVDVNFRTSDGVHLLTAEPDGRVVADRTEAFAWETWTVQRKDDGVTLKSAHGKYLSAQPDGTLEANRAAAYSWEVFEVVPAGDGVGLKGHHGMFVVAEGGGGGDVNANRAYSRPGLWESFKPSKALPGKPGVGVAVGRLVLTERGYEAANGPTLPVYSHAGNLFSLYTRDPLRAQSELDNVAKAGYRGVRVWSTLGGPYWEGDHVGPDVTPDYWSKVRGFALELTKRNLRAVWSQGDVGQLRDRRAYMTKLAEVDNAAGGFIDFVDCGNEAWQTGEPDPARLAQCVGYYQSAGGQAVRSLTSPPGETKDLLDAFSIPPAQVWDVHSWRDGHWYDKRRHIFSISYEGKPRLRYGINSEPPGNGTLVSASENKDELDDEAVALLGVAAAMSRQAYVWFSGEGVKIRAGLATEAGFWSTPRAVALLPPDVMSWPILHHSGERWRGTRILAAVDDEVRVDCAQGNGQFACTIDGPAGSYRFPVERTFTGRLCHPGTGECTDVMASAGATFPVSFKRGRVLTGRFQ